MWAAWTDPVHVARWWGPRGFTNTIEHMDVRPGGTWRFVMHGPDGTDYRNESVYVEVTRDFDAPRARVFEAWTRAEHLARWWAPRGFTVPSCELDFRTGGAYRMVMRGPDGAESPFHGVYREIVPGERITFSAVIGPARGDAVVTTAVFEDAGGKTRVTVRQTVPANGLAARGQKQGWTETLENLGAYLARAR